MSLQVIGTGANAFLVTLRPYLDGDHVRVKALGLDWAEAAYGVALHYAEAAGARAVSDPWPHCPQIVDIQETQP